MIWLSLAAVLMLLFPSDIIACAAQACALFASTVLPGLYPFLVIMLMMTSRLPKHIKTIPMAVMGILSGSPTGARLSGYGTFTKKHYRAFSHLTAVMSPMFMLGTVATWLSGYGVLVFLSCTTAALLTALLSYLLPMKEGRRLISGEQANESKMPLSKAVSTAAQTMLTVCGCMVMGSCLSMILFKLFPIQSPLARALLSGVLEVTGGIKAVTELAFSDPRLTPALTAMLISFGGISLMLQNYAFYIRSALPVIPYIAFKCLHAAMAFFICYILMPLFQNTAAPAAAPVTVFSPLPLYLFAASFLLGEIVLQWKRQRLHKGENSNAPLKQH